MSRRIDSIAAEFDSDFGRIQQALNGADDYSRVFLSRFLIIRTCGFLEKTFELAIQEWVTSQSSPYVCAFVGSHFGRGANPSPEKMVATLRRFDQSFATVLQEKLNENNEELSREINFLVNRRNRIAHGESEGITPHKAIMLARTIREFTKWYVCMFA